jgi:hypothetical protein
MTEKIRKSENLHVLLWLIKAACWMMDIKLLGSIMVLPTIGMAAYVCHISKKELNNLLPNLAVLCWISANSLWMLFDFYQWTLKHYALCFFAVGFVFILMYLYRISILGKKAKLTKNNILTSKHFLHDKLSKH